MTRPRSSFIRFTHLAVLAVGVGFPSLVMGQVLLASNYNSNRIVKINTVTGAVTTFATGSGLTRPDGLVVLANGDVLVANFDGRILRFNSNGVFENVFATPGGNVQALAVDSEGNVYSVSFSSNLVRRYSPSGASLGVFGTASGVTNPVALVFDPRGDLLVQGLNSGNIAKLDRLTGSSSILIPRGAGGLNRCEGLAIGADGNIYVGSIEQDAVLRFNGETGAFIDVFAGVEPPLVITPQGLCFGPNGDIYFSGFEGNVFRFDGESGVLVSQAASISQGNLSNGLIWNAAIPAACGPADLASEGAALTPDGVLDNNDFIAFIQFFFDGDARADFGSDGASPTPDGIFDNNDFIVFINAFFAGC